MAIEVSAKEFRNIIRNSSTIKSNQEKESKPIMQNKLSDLNNYLFEQLERLNDDDLNEEQFKKEVARSKAISSIASSIVGNANIMFKATKFLEEQGYSVSAPKEALNLLGVKDGEKM